MNGKQHLVIGATVGEAFSVLKYFHRKETDETVEFQWSELLLDMGLGALFASLPDIIEPATSPHHRKFFHSVLAGSAVGYGAFGQHSEKWDTGLKQSMRAIAVSYLSHLVADSTTARSIALIHPKLI